MLKNYHKFIFIVFLIVWVILPFQIFALEITKYPTTITGSTITGTSGLTQYLKYLFDFGISIGIAIAVLTMFIAGIFYFIAPISPNALAIAKDRISGAISGLLILLLTYTIITTINPYLKFFTLTPLSPVEIASIDTTYYGVNFYKLVDCSGEAQTNTSDVADFGDLNSNIFSTKISQNYDGDTYYISIVYDNPNYWGKCQYIYPNNECQKMDISVNSATIYEYDFSPSNNGSITLYRKSFNGVSGKEENKDGGYLEITQSDIYDQGGVFEENLNNLRFTGTVAGKNCTVPEKEQDCAKWDDKGKCTEYQCPLLSGENISSIKIEGEYLVLIDYLQDINFYSNLDRVSVYTFCQAFPTDRDINKQGSQQLKWDPIENAGYSPNHILILPIKN